VSASVLLWTSLLLLFLAAAHAALAVDKQGVTRHASLTATGAKSLEPKLTPMTHFTLDEQD